MMKIAQIGCGYWGRNLARNFGRLGVLGAIVDDSPVHADPISAEFGAARIGFDQVLADPGIAALSFATPAETHAALARRALEAGKHVFVEKPLALSLEDAEGLVALAAERGRVLMVGHLLQYHPIFAEMRRQIIGGRIGRLRYVYSNRLSFGKFRVEENVLWSFAPHDVSMLLALVGEAPDEVSATGYCGITPGIADWSITHLRFPSGLAGHIQASWLHPFKEHRLVAIGEEGMMVFEDSRPVWEEKLAFYNATVDMSGPVPQAGKADPDYIAVPQDEPLKLECQHFLDCIAENKTPRTDGAEGLEVLRVLRLAEENLAAEIGK